MLIEKSQINKSSINVTPIVTRSNTIERSTLSVRHKQEWLKSGVDERIVDLNVRSISGQFVVDALNLDLSQHWQQISYEPVLNGGWICQHIFKADKPRTSHTKAIKYENALGIEAKPIKLQLPEELWQDIAKKYGVEKPEHLDGWAWVEANPQIPIAVVEGVKKAGCVISALLIPTIALNGHTSAYKKGGDIRFKEFVNPARTIYVCFDNDLKTSVRTSVNNTINGIINRLYYDDNLKPLANPRAIIKVCQWKGAKGIDDIAVETVYQEACQESCKVLYKLNKDKAADIFNHAVSPDNWVDNSTKTLGFEPAITFNSKQFQNFEIHPEVTLIGVVGNKGTGKTWFLEQQTKKAVASKRPIALSTHRIQLSRANATRLGLSYIDDIDEKVSAQTNLALVIDSLAKIDPDKFKGGLIIIDEVVQVIEHLMTSDTCKHKRQQILKALAKLAKTIRETNGQFILADADLDEKTLRFFIGLLGEHVEPYIIQNTYNEPSYTCYINHGLVLNPKTNKFTSSPADTVAAILHCALKGDRLFISTTGQSEESSYGTINLEKLLLSHGVTGVIRIDSETIKNPEHPAYKATTRINELCDVYKIIIASPTLNTGVSIENKIPFDYVFSIVNLGSADAARQGLIRVRDTKPPRIIYAANHSLSNLFSNLGETETEVDKKQRSLTATIEGDLIKFDEEFLTEHPEIKVCDTTKAYFNQLISTKNKESKNFKKYIRQGLIDEGVDVVEINNISAMFPAIEQDITELKNTIKETKKQSVTEYKQELLKQMLLSDEDYQKLKNATELTDTSRVALEAKVLSKRYGEILPISEALIDKDKDGYLKKLRLHYTATTGYEVSKNLSLLAASTQIAKAEEKLIQHDFNERHRLMAQVEFIKESGILDFLEHKEEISALDSDWVNLYQFLINNQSQFELIFGRKLEYRKADNFSVKPLQIFLSYIGIETDKASKKGSRDNRTNVYAIKKDAATIEDKQLLFPVWLERDTEKAQKWEERKHTWEINRAIAKCTATVDLAYLDDLKAKSIFDEVWERTDTLTRIKLINRADNYSLPTPTKKEINPNAPDYQEILADIATWQEISLDIETYGLDSKNKEGLHARKGRIRLIQISNGERIYYVDLGGREATQCNIQLRQFLDLLNKQISNPDIKIIGQNIHFDLRFLRFQLGFNRPKNVADTMLGAKVFFGDYGSLKVLPGGYGLGNLATKFLGLPVDKTEQKSDWGAVLTTSQIDYAVKDPFITYHLYKRLLEAYSNPAKFGFGKLAQDGLLEAWQLENDVIACAIELEVNGLPFDELSARANLESCKKIQAELLQQWSDLVPGLNYTQVQKLAVYLREKYNLAIKSLNKTRLAELKEYPEVALLGQLRAIKVPIQQLESLLKSAEQTGRVQTVFNTLTGTGRFSSGNSKVFKDLPNLQSISAKVNPSLKSFNLPGVRTCVTNGYEKLKYWVINQNDAKKQLKTYNTLLLQAPEYKEYITKAIQHLEQIISTDTDFVEYDRYNLNWSDDKNFVEKFKDYNPKLKTVARGVPDLSIVIVDLAASHGRIAADVADDETAIAGCNDDSIDNHSKVAVYIAKALNQDVTWEYIAKNKKDGEPRIWRDAAKNTYYGWLNGAGAKRVQEQVKANTGKDIEIEACKAAITGCEELYPNVVNFRKTLVERLSDKKHLLHIDGKYYAVNKIDSVNNRITHLVNVDDDNVDLPYTQCLAAIWSRTEATALKRALIKLVALAEEKPEWQLKPINYVHDEINVECNSLFIKDVAIAVNTIIGDCFAETLSKVSDGRETNWTKLVVNNWSEK